MIGLYMFTMFVVGCRRFGVVYSCFDLNMQIFVAGVQTHFIISWECYGVLLVKFPLILQKIFVKYRSNTHVYQRLQRSRPITKYLLWFGCLS